MMRWRTANNRRKSWRYLRNDAIRAAMRQVNHAFANYREPSPAYTITVAEIARLMSQSQGKL